ncbi:MAG: helix-turn-helix domain-containing protein [Rhodoferax sp.]
MPGAGASERLALIAQARRSLLQERGLAPALPCGLDPAITRSWQRCLAAGADPRRPVEFDLIGAPLARHTQERHPALLQCASPLLEQLGRAIANTRYFALLTDAQGVVLAACGAIDRSDRRAERITRVGANLSEAAIGTSAIGLALAEQRPVWLHRGEHFFDTNQDYSCAGAPVFGAQGECLGMIDVTGIRTDERPELRHLVQQTAQRLQSALVQAQPHALLLRLNWPGSVLGADADALVALDADGAVVACNQPARDMLPMLRPGARADASIADMLGVGVATLFDAARQSRAPFEVPLWSGLRLQVLALSPSGTARKGSRHSAGPGTEPLGGAAPLKAVESALIRNAIDTARGNVAQAAQALGISRATLYRRLGQRGAGKT